MLADAVIIPFPKVKQSPTLWPGLLVCIMETLVPEDASKSKDEVEGQDDNDEVCVHANQRTTYCCWWVHPSDACAPNLPLICFI